MTSHRTLIIGLDGATFVLIDTLIEAGELPIVLFGIRQDDGLSDSHWPS